MVPRIKKILYATDLSKNSAYAAYFALDLAHKNKAEVVILHCTDPIIPDSVWAEARHQGKETPAKDQEPDTEIKRRLGKLYEKVGDKINRARINVVSGIIVRQGYPVEEILATADAEKCDLIVLGTHGKGWLKQAFLGSTARSVLERSRKPVLIVPLPADKLDIAWD